MELMTNAEPEVPLSVREQKRLSELEGIIAENFKGFVAVGMALAEIREQRLYRQSYNTFEAYCLELWDMAYRHANRLIASAEVIDNLSTNVNGTNWSQTNDEMSPIGDIINVKNFSQPTNPILPSNEAQARELAKLSPEEQVQVWQDLIDQSKQGSKITAKAIKNAVTEFKGGKVENAIKKTKEETQKRRTEFKSEDFTEAFSAFLDQVNIERMRNWRYTPRQVVFEHLLTLTEIVGEADPKELQAQGCAMQLSDREKLGKAG
ncbi:MAG: hypothetical protein OEV64_01870, partial [Desulfobulbaceae bacterium]|nr:hypothetical protein [Desulfobulbaceae bacterium]